ncbi:MAG TPA: Fe-S cluster assembly protein SufD [Pyrinomonadaceae bacterium]|jgi:Fe-S cluster assembly protein SufD
MAQAIKEQSAYAAAFEAAQTQGAPDWLTRLRADAFARFEQTGFPTTDEEDWKYTNVAPVARAPFTLAGTTDEPAADATAESAAHALAARAYAEAARSRLVFVNGRYRPDLSALDALPAGAFVADLADALAGPHEALVREHLARAAQVNEQADGFNALNTAFLAHGAFVHLPKGVQLTAPLHLLFLAEPAAGPAFSFPRVLVVAERESAATIVESYEATRPGAYVTDAVVEVFVGESARVTHYKVQREDDEAFHVAATHAELERYGFYDLTTITLGARLSRHGIRVALAHEGAECRVDGLYLVATGQHADTHSLIDHVAPHCTSQQLYKGILDGKARAVFNGKVFVHRDARQTDARQTNKNLLLSPEARVDAKPQLEIFNDDVKCAHGATVGQLEEEELFYLLSRGLHPELARNLLTYGFAEELVEKIKLPSIKAQLDEAILNRLRARLEA